MAPAEPTRGDAKPFWRRHYRERRDQQPAQGRQRLLEQALMAVPPLIGTSGRLGLYWPLPGEPDLLALAAALPGRTALPAIRGEADRCRLLYEAWSPDDPVGPDAMGVPAPTPAGIPLPARDLDLLLVPALAFDRRGLRLGYGGGWYDRLRAASDWRSVPALIVAPAACAVKRLPDDPWDVPFDGWLTEQGIEWLQAVERRRL